MTEHLYRESPTYKPSTCELQKYEQTLGMGPRGLFLTLTVRKLKVRGKDASPSLLQILIALCCMRLSGPGEKEEMPPNPPSPTLSWAVRV